MIAMLSSWLLNKNVLPLIIVACFAIVLGMNGRLNTKLAEHEKRQQEYKQKIVELEESLNNARNTTKKTAKIFKAQRKIERIVDRSDAALYDWLHKQANAHAEHS